MFTKVRAVDAYNIDDIQQVFTEDVYSITPGGEIAATNDAIYETATGNKLYDLPVTATVQTISSDYTRLTYYDSAARSLKSIDLIAATGLQWGTGVRRVDYRLRINGNGTDLDNDDDQMIFEDAENSHGTANVPQLVITWRLP